MDLLNLPPIARVIMGVIAVGLMFLAGYLVYRDKFPASPKVADQPKQPPRRPAYDSVITMAEFARETGNEAMANAAVAAFTELVRLPRPVKNGVQP